MEESRIIANNLNNGDMTIQQSSNSYSSCTSSSPYSSVLRSQVPNRSYPMYNRPLPYLRPTLGGCSPESVSLGAGKRLAILPPLSPHSSRSTSSSPSSASGAAAALASPSHHSRSLSQPAFFHLDSFPQTSSPPMPDVALDFPAKARAPIIPSSGSHRRSRSDIPWPLAGSGYCLSPAWVTTVQRASQHDSPGSGEVAAAAEERYAVNAEATGQDGDGEDLVSVFLNLDNYESLDCLAEKKEDIDYSRISGSRTNNNGGGDSSENEAESSSNGSSEIKQGNKRLAVADLMLPSASGRHFRSLSVGTDMSNLHLREESLRFPPYPSIQTGTFSRSASSQIGTLNMFSFESGKFEFNSTELKKIMANEKLAEMAIADPKRVKRILANRQSAARSKERKLRYIAELEHKVKNLEAEATTLSAQLNIMQRDSAGLTSQNNELRYRIQAMEQQAQLRDALNQTLAAEIQRLKFATGGGIGELQLSTGANQQVNMTAQMLQLHQFCSSNQLANVVSQQQSQPAVEQQKHGLHQNGTHACLTDAK